MKRNINFWTLRENLPDDVGYNQFSIKHIMMLVGVIFFSFIISYIYIHSSSDIKSYIKIMIAITLMVIEIMKLAVIHFEHGDVFNYLPIEICSFAGYCILIDALNPNPTFIREMLLIIFLPAAIMALIYPTTVVFPVWNFFTIHQFVFHGLIVAYVSALFFAKEIAITYIGVWKSILAILCIASIVYLYDRINHRNFMFLMHDEGNSMLKGLTKISGGGTKYTLTLVLFCIIMVHVFYFIFKLLERIFII